MDLRAIKSYYESRYVPGDMGPSLRLPNSYQLFIDWLSIQPEDRLLDVACGVGPLLQRAGRQVDSWGIDLSERAARAAQSAAPWSKLAVGDAQHLPYVDSSFDQVTNLGGLEHVPSMVAALREMSRVCKDNGILCIMVPNANFLWYRLLPLEGTQQAAMLEHLLTLDEWRRLLRTAGLRILQVEADRGPGIRTDLGMRMFLRSVFRRMALLATRVMPVTATYQFVFVCSKASEDG